MQKAYQLAGQFPVASLVGEQGLWLPSANQLTDQQIDHVCNAIREFYG
jgi:dTDP-4-amino-4,6-dideoxygalactose transaminase